MRPISAPGPPEARNKKSDDNDNESVVGDIGQVYQQRFETNLRGVNLRYLRLLNAVVKEYMPDIVAAYGTEQSSVDSMRMDGFFDFQLQIRFIFNLIRTKLAEQQAEVELEKAIHAVATNTHKFSVRQWRELIKKVLGLDIREDYFMGAEYEALIESWTVQNVSYITSISNECLNEMEQVVTDAFLRGRSIRELVKDIQGRFDVSKSKARLLARDQMGTLSSQLTQTQHKQAGVSRYKWSDSGDERVRSCHAELNGKIFSYDDPPAMWYWTKKRGRVYTGRYCNPGEDYQCRCVAIPVFEPQALNTSVFR